MVRGRQRLVLQLVVEGVSEVVHCGGPVGRLCLDWLTLFTTVVQCFIAVTSAHA